MVRRQIDRCVSVCVGAQVWMCCANATHPSLRIVVYKCGNSLVVGVCLSLLLSGRVLDGVQRIDTPRLAVR